MELNILGSREIKRLMERLDALYGFSGELDYLILKSTKDRIYLMSRDFGRIDNKRLRIDSLGLYFATMQGQEFRLSIEGSQLIGPYSSKGIIDVNDAQSGSWLKGEDIEMDSSPEGFLLVRHNNDFMGSGRISKGRLLNHVPKTRRIGAVI